MEHLLQKSKCSIFHSIFKYMIFQRRQKVSLRGKGLTFNHNKKKISKLIKLCHIRSTFCTGTNKQIPDQLASKRPADLDLHCFQNKNISRFIMIRVHMAGFAQA